MKSADYQQSAVETSTAEIAEHGRLSDFSQLIKTRLTFLVLVTTGVGFYVGARGPVDLVRLFNVLMGAALAAAGASALNQWSERDLDALMSRTRARPVPAGRMRAGSALILGCSLALVGIVYLAITTNFLATLLTALTVVILHFRLHPPERHYYHHHFGRRISSRASAFIRMAAARQLDHFVGLS